MTGQQVVDDVRRELLEPIAGFWTDAELLYWLNRGESNYARQVHDLEFSTPLSTVQGTAGITLPTGVLSVRGAYFNKPNGDGTARWIRLIPTNVEKMGQERPNFLATDAAVQDTPQKYWIWGNTFYLDPVPNITASNNVTLFYKGKPTPLVALSDSINIDDSLGDALVHFVCWRAWKKEKELELAQEEKAEYQEMVGEGRRWVKKRSGDQSYRVDVQTGIPFLRSGPSSTLINPF